MIAGGPRKGGMVFPRKRIYRRGRKWGFGFIADEPRKGINSCKWTSPYKVRQIFKLFCIEVCK